ncbi:MAG: alpha/beta hydrolase [Candidatus Binataceae bacterium]
MSESSGEPPSANAPRADTTPFFFPGEGASALLIHGFTGTPYEMRYLGERLAARGVRVLGVKLAGHAGAPWELGLTGPGNWYQSAVSGFEELRRYGDPIVAVGLSMGAALAARLAADQRQDVAGVAMLAPGFFIAPAAAMGLRIAALFGSLADKIYLYNDKGSDIHDAAARAIQPKCRLMPLGAAVRLLELSAIVRPRLARIAQPALVIHSKKDHTCPIRRNLDYVMRHLGSVEKRAIELEDSYHVITVDSDKERVADEVGEFVMGLRAAPQKRALG